MLQVYALLASEFVRHPVYEALVEVVAAEMGVAVGRHDLENAVPDLEDGNVERPAAEVVHGDFLVAFLVQPVGERCGGGFVDDAEDFQSGDASGVFGGVALAVVEVGGDGYHRLRDGFAEVGFGVLLHLLQNHRGDFGRGVAVARHFDVGVAVGVAGYFVRHKPDVALDAAVFVAPPHEALDGEYGVFGVGDGLALGGGAHVALVGAGVYGDHRGGGAPAFGVFNHARLAAVYDRHARVGRA